MANQDDDTRDRFEQFTASPSWRSLPLKIKLMLVHIWRAERDVNGAQCGVPDTTPTSASARRPLND